MEFSQVSEKMDYINPLEAFKAIREDGSYLLQSIGSEGKKARYTIIGFNPLLKIKFSKKDTQITGLLKDKITVPKKGTTIERLRDISNQIEVKNPLPELFNGGLVGYLAYDIIYEKLVFKNKVVDDNYASIFSLCKNNVIYDHITHETIITGNYYDQIKPDLKKEIDQLKEKCEEPEPCFVDKFEPNQTEDEFKKSVELTKEYIKEGDIFQTVISQRFTGKYTGDPFYAYQKLLEINPSPYMYFLDFGDIQIAGSSPETLARVEQRTAFTYPIAGTRKRGKNPIIDSELERELRNDPKEIAEHLMLVDLGRNDLGKVCEYGSVEVSKFMETEYFSHVMHLSSEVKGTIKDKLDCFDVLDSVYPAGTVSGAPKVRAMEIIQEMEPTTRGAYAGSVGYFSFNKNMDTAITIRSIIFEEGLAKVQAGAGIVADSDPLAEFKETQSKARALLKVLEAKK